MRSPLPRLRVNKTWAVQGIYNLVANALKFVAPGTPPDIEIAPATEIDLDGEEVVDWWSGSGPRRALRSIRSNL